MSARHNSVVSVLRTFAVGLLVAIGVLTFAPSDAAAQSFNVVQFACVESQGEFVIDVDIRGIGNTNVCVAGTFTADQDCACVSGSGSCPQAANKASVATTSTVAAVLRPEGGRINTDVPIDVATSDTCGLSEAQCGTGQTPTLIQQSITGTATACTNFDIDPETGDCTCTNLTGSAPNILRTTACPTGDPDVIFAGRRNSCVELVNQP